MAFRTATFRTLTSRLRPVLATGFLLFAAGAASAADGRVTASYAISIAGINVGRADAESRFDDGGYSIAIRGFTSGVSRLVSDARALMASNGRIRGGTVQPATFSLETTENGLSAQVSMTLRSRAVSNLSAEPQLMPFPDRVPITSAHKRNVVDPLSAFIVAINQGGEIGGEEACNRTISVFDGWQRYDVRLAYARTRAVQGGSSTYSGPIIVCSARYVPVAGHRPDQDSVQYMANNRNMEVWLMPVEGQRILIPYQMQIGTKIGDLVISLTSFSNDLAGRNTANAH